MLGSHRDNAHFTRARWRKRVILPCWIIQIAILLGLMGLFSWRLSHTVTTWKEAEDKGDVPVVEFVWEVANIAFSLASLAVTFVSIARFIAEVLTPLPLLFGCILNLVLSAAVLALDIVVYVQRADKKYSIIGLGLDVALIIFTIIPLIYAIIIYRRLLTYDDYHLPGNHKPFGFMGVEEASDDPSPPIYLSAPTAYDPTKHGLGTITTVTAVEPQPRGRSLSFGSRRISLNLTRGTSPSPQTSPPLPDPVTERRTSYDHKRDTQFEAYLARRTSQTSSYRDRDSLSFHDDVKRALGTEFGFSDLPTPADPKAFKGDKSVHSGTVQAAHVSLPRVSSIPLAHQTSYEVIVGGTKTTGNGGQASPSLTIMVTTPPEEQVQLGHSLNCVPEAHEEEDPHANRQVQRKRATSESEQALLGESDGRRSSVSGGGGRRRGSPRQFERVEGLQDIELDNRKRRRDS